MIISYGQLAPLDGFIKKVSHRDLISALINEEVLEPLCSGGWISFRPERSARVVRSEAKRHVLSSPALNEYLSVYRFSVMCSVSTGGV